MPTLSDLSSFTTALIATAALYIASDQLNSSNASAAKTIYKDYLSLAFENPEFSAASYPIENPKFFHIRPESPEFERYEYFVSILLFSAEEILALDEGQAWKSTLQLQMKYHAVYLNSDNFNIENYSCETRALIELALHKYSLDQANYSLLLSPATSTKKNDECQPENQSFIQEAISHIL